MLKTILPSLSRAVTNYVHNNTAGDGRRQLRSLSFCFTAQSPSLCAIKKNYNKQNKTNQLVLLQFYSRMLAIKTTALQVFWRHVLLCDEK